MSIALKKHALHDIKPMVFDTDFWFIARPEPLKQILLLKSLRARDVEYFNPMITTSKRTGRGGMRVERKSMLQGYVPVRFRSEEQKIVTEQAPGFLQLMRSGPERYLGFTTDGIEYLKRMEQSTVKERKEMAFKIGDLVRIVDGPFSSFEGKIEELPKDERQKVGQYFFRLRVGANIFGRITPVELESSQIEKV